MRTTHLIKTAIIVALALIIAVTKCEIAPEIGYIVATIAFIILILEIFIYTLKK